MTTRLRPWALLLAVAIGCGGGQTRLNLFSTDWEDDRGTSIDRVWRRVGSAPVPPATDVAIGVAGHAEKIVGLPLKSDPSKDGGGLRWTFAHPVESRPVVAGSVVVGSGGGEAFALDAASGQLIWRRPTGGLTVIGAGDDGTVTVVALQRAGGTGTTLLAVTHDGQVVRQIETGKALGVPAVVDRMAFVPWAGQYVSVIDLSNGDEAARVTLREHTTEAWTSGGSLWFGGAGFIRFDSRIAGASMGQASRTSVPKRELPGTPRLMRTTFAPPPLLANAEDRLRLYARPVSDDAPGGARASIGDDRWYATYFRVAMGFDAGEAKLAWAHLHGADFIGGGVGAASLVLCDEQGHVTTFDSKNGSILSEADLGEPVQTCVVNVDALKATGVPRYAKPLAAQLAEIVLADDAQLVTAQRFLVRELAAQPDDAATKTLVDLASDPRTGPDLLADARGGLASRRSGEAFMEAALARHYDYLKDVLRAPPVGPIAQALGAMKARAAAPLLAAHLFDPADTDDDVKQAAAALVVVAGPGEVPAMRRFFGMYRATADTDDVAAAVASVGEGLLALDDEKGRSLVTAAAKDPATVAYARERLEALLAAQPPRAHVAHLAVDTGTPTRASSRQ